MTTMTTETTANADAVLAMIAALETAEVELNSIRCAADESGDDDTFHVARKALADLSALILTLQQTPVRSAANDTTNGGRS